MDESEEWEMAEYIACLAADLNALEDALFGYRWPLAHDSSCVQITRVVHPEHSQSLQPCLACLQAELLLERLSVQMPNDLS